MRKLVPRPIRWEAAGGFYGEIKPTEFDGAALITRTHNNEGRMKKRPFMTASSAKRYLVELYGEHNVRFFEE